MNLQQNYQAVFDSVKAYSSDREVTLVAVSKRQPVEKIQSLYALGHRDFGENKVQELVEKIPILAEDIRWHLIGHLQKNKVKYIVDKVYLIHSVDNYDLALEIDKRAKAKQVTSNILIQVNVSGEESKFGTKPNELINLVTKVSELSNIRIKGLMTMAPFAQDVESTRAVFTGLKDLSVSIEKHKLPNVEMQYLSMGMSNDYHVALQEGSNIVRIGSKLFGQRDY